MDRYEELTVVLQYDSYGEKHLSAFDRMFIQSERSALMNNAFYKLPPATEMRVQKVLSIVNQLKWKSPFNN
ncbi:hypothetical protein HZR00_00915 [Elizabethkingia anophelis]|nr:hypothetical protein [Elizabethkingia anophelis]